MLDDHSTIRDLIAERAGGPMKLRLIIQPTVALILAIRAGLKDARTGSPPFFWAVLTNPGRRRELLRHAWKDVGKVFVIAAVLDLVYQTIAGSGIRVLETLIVATILAIVPYILFRGPVSRIARRTEEGRTR